MKIVEAEVYNLDFWNLKTISHDNVTIEVIDNFEKLRDKVKKLREPDNNIVTGRVLVNIPANIENYSAIDYVREIMHNYDLLLSFAQCRDIFFQNYRLYEIKNGEKKHISTKISGIRTGKKFSIPTIYHNGIDNFLKIGIPLLNSDDYNRQTGIRRILAYWRECKLYTSSVLEINIPLLFSALEVASNTFYDQNPQVFLFSEKKWEEILSEMRNLCDTLQINGYQKDRLLGSIGFLKSGSAKEKIQYLLDNLGFPRYDKDISNIIKLRNDITHGRVPKEKYGVDDAFDVALKCEKLVEKIILKHLNFLDKSRFLHSAYTKEDLRARM